MAIVLLKEIRIQRKVSLTQLGMVTGVSKSSLQRIENNITSPNLNQLEKIAKGLKVHISDLYDSKYK